ncbi:MAG: rod shape-determining protein MreC [Actinomycetes bacterium]
MPRNRTVRLAVLGSSAAAPGNSQNRSSALRRRLVILTLVMASLVLITISFRSSALDSAQSYGASALRPFEIVATRVARPFRDGAGWARGLFDAKAQNRKLTREVEQLRQLVARQEGAVEQNIRLQKLLRYANSPSFPQDYDWVAAQVLTSPSDFNQSVTIAAGRDRGIALQDIVVTNRGLVGQVTKVFASQSRVTLITDPDSAVRAVDEISQSAIGIVDHGSAVDSLVFDRVTKDKKVSYGDTIITAGSPGNGKLPSLYPRNILIGVVTSVNQSDTEIFKDIQVEPFVDFSSLQSVLVLIPKPTPAGR